MHTSIRLDIPIEFINVTPMNPLISKCQIKVCYVGDAPNRNKSIITKEVAREMANSLPGSPIVGYYSKEDKDFEEHNRVIELSNGKFELKDTTRPYGFVDLNARAWFQKFLDDGVEHEYLMTEGYLWTGQYPETRRIIEKGNNQSMELDEESLKGNWTKNTNGEGKFFIINEAIISKLCILGEDWEPCFEGATITKFSFGDSFKEQLLKMMEQIKELLEKEGGQPVVIEDNVVVEDTTVVEEVVVEEPVAVIEEPVVEEPEVEEVVVEEPVIEPEVKEPEVIEEPVIEEPAAIEEPAPAEEDEAGNVQFAKEEVCAKCGKEKSECKCEEEDKKEKYNLDEIQEYMDLKAEYSALESNYNSLSTELETLKTEYAKLVDFKNTIDREKKEAMIDSFYMLSDEDKKDVLDNIDTYSLDDIEAKLSIICVRNKVSFDLEEDKVKDASTSYSYNVDFENVGNVPAWIKSVKSVAKEMK